jgi:membrane protein YqaA with SNARE-associated domain
MKHPVLRTIARLERYATRIWYTPLVALLAAADLFILIVPTDALVISNAALRPKHWIWIAVWSTLGSALGSFALCLAIQGYGAEFLHLIGFAPESSATWQSTAQWVREYQGPALAVFAVGPFPLQPAVVVGSVAGVPPLSVLLWVGLGRAIKFFFFSWAATHAPNLLNRIWGLRTEVELLHAAEQEVREKEGTAATAPVVVPPVTGDGRTGT